MDIKIVFNKKNKKILTNKCAADYVAIEQAANHFLSLLSEARKQPKNNLALNMIINENIERIAHIYAYSSQYDFTPSIANYNHLTNQLRKLYWGIGILEYILESSHDDSKKSS